MLETVLFFTLVSVITEVILMLHLPKAVRRRRGLLGFFGLVITLLVTVFNFWVGWGTVTGTLTAKLAFVGGFIATPIVWLLSKERRPLQLRMRLYLFMRRFR